MRVVGKPAVVEVGSDDMVVPGLAVAAADLGRDLRGL
jgi:hypothetical protein